MPKDIVQKLEWNMQVTQIGVTTDWSFRKIGSFFCTKMKE